MTPSSTALKTLPPAVSPALELRMAANTPRRALPDFRQLAVEDFLDKYEAASPRLIHSKPQSATS
jgi:hypothetical protein